MNNVNDALSSLYLELPGEVAADVNGIVRNHIANLEAEIARCKEIAERADKLADALEMITTFDPSDGQCDNGYPPQDEARMALDAYRDGFDG